MENEYPDTHQDELEESPEQHDHEAYEQDDDPEYIGEKLLDSKAARKRADEDAKLLSNRIALLKMEE